MSFKPRSSKKPVSYEQMTLRKMAREDTGLYLNELRRVALGRQTIDAELQVLTEEVAKLTTALKRRKMDGHEAVSALHDIVAKVSTPPDTSDMLKAIDMLLLRGWGRPSNETVDYSDFIEMDETRAASMVKAALIAKAMTGDVAAQQAVLRLPTQVEILGIGDDELDASNLDEKDLATFLSLIEKMKTGKSKPSSSQQEYGK